MRPTGELVAYLDSYFAPEVWRAAVDLLRNVAISDTDAELRDFDLVNGLAEARAVFDTPPGVTALQGGGVRLRLPRGGRHRLETVIAVTDPLPDPDLDAELLLQVEAGAGAPNVTVDIDTDFHWVSDLVILAAGPLAVQALILKRVLESLAGSVIAGHLEAAMRERMNGLNTYRYARQPDLQWAVGVGEPVDGSFVPAFRGSVNPQTRGYVDIVLVADGYSQADIGAFDQVANRVRNHLGGMSRLPEAPFANYRSAMRVWKMALVAVDPADPLERLAIPVVGPGGEQLNFANLARLAEVGLDLRAAFGRDPIVVIVSQVSAADRDAAEIDAGASIESNAQGPYVLLRANAGGGVADLATRTLVHELGHTPLGRYLADEYPDAGTSCPYPAGTKRYRGPEPQARNVSTNPVMGWLKWRPWSGSLAGLQFFVGGYEHDLGVVRFQDECRMRCSTGRSAGRDFCPVCREELALGFLEWGHARAGSAATPGMIDLTVQTMEPWTDPEPQPLHVSGGATRNLEVFDDGTPFTPSTRVALSVAGSSVPDPWEMTWRVFPAELPGSSSERTGQSLTLVVRPGARIDVSVRHDLAGGGLLDPARTPPETSATLVFDQVRRPAAADLQPPYDLVQSVAVGAHLAPQIDPATGALSLPEVLWLQATIGGLRDFALSTQLRFGLLGPAAFEREETSAFGLPGDTRRWVLRDMLPPGHYVWRARGEWRNLTSAWVDGPAGAAGYAFVIDPIPFAGEPRPPADPFDLHLVETATYPPLPAGLRASSWHPNDDRLRLEFELKPDVDAFDGQGVLETDLLARDPQNYASLAVTGQVLFRITQISDGAGDLYKWRVRAVDEQGRASGWVQGRSFMVFMPAQRPKTLDELARIIDRINPQVLDPRGPRETPRLFLAEDVTGEGGIADLEALQRWVVRGEKLR